MDGSVFQSRKRNGILFSVIAVVLLLALALYFVPVPTRIDLTLDAVKVDEEGNQIGTVQIMMAGYRYDYLLQPDRLDLYIHPFDGMISFSYFDNLKGQINAMPHGNFLYADYAAYSEQTGFGEYFYLCFSPDLTRWALVDIINRISYVASVDGEYTTQELIEYFRMF